MMLEIYKRYDPIGLRILKPGDTVHFSRLETGFVVAFLWWNLYVIWKKN